MTKFDHKKIEKKWQKFWQEKNIYKTKEDFTKEKYYILDMFPYPSGAGLHVGHPKGYIASDVVARMKMMQGLNVLHPMGWDAFGLPAENYAIENKVHPREAVEKNVQVFKKQLQKIGFTYDWEKEVNTTDPEYYKWTQWAFIKMFEKGLAYESEEPITWCPSCKTGLAMEDLENGKCERCSSEVEKKPMRQWVLKITDYADRLLYDLDKLNDWPEPIKEMQRNWIGRSEGAEVVFKIKDHDHEIKVFTTRADTLFGATFLALAPEHPLVDEITLEENKKEVEKYAKTAAAKSDLERAELQKDKSGVFTGAYAINPVNGKEIPIWVADYVLMGYGTGSIMAVPAHDKRDFEFAKKYNLDIIEVIVPKFGQKKNDAERRDGVAAVLVNDKNQMYVLKHQSLGTYRLPAGGYEKNEDTIETLSREIVEETGYLDFEIKDYLGQFEANYYAHDKKVERHRYQKGYLVKLKSTKQQKTDLQEYEDFKGEWMDLKKAVSLFEENDQNYGEIEFIRRVIDPTRVNFCGNGVNVNSDFLDGLETLEAKEKITDWLENKKSGKATVEYKLQDWVFSRQRYWGEPIPIIHCEECKKQVLENAHQINFYNQKTWAKLISGKKTVETRALNPEEKDRYFGNIKEGAYLKAVNKKSGEDKYFVVEKVFQYKNLQELFKDKEALTKIYAPSPIPESLEELEKSYSFTDNYVEKINVNGLIAWQVRLINPGVFAVPEKDLPVELPKVKSYEPTGTGESPLAGIDSWVNVKCPKCGGAGKRETNTMPQWAGSNWYYLRYIDPKNDQALIDPAKEKYWMPIDFYIGGAEHATRHLIYSRFWHKFLFDIKVVSTDEPFKRFQNVGLIMAEDGRKMSKRWGNVINPDDVIEEYGADAFRTYEMFMGPFDQPVVWDTNGLRGVKKFLDKVYEKGTSSELGKINDLDNSKEVKTLLHKTIKKVTEDISTLDFNTAVSQMMIFMNKIQVAGCSNEDFKLFLQCLSPFAPHLTEDLWSKLGEKQSIFVSEWPKFDEKLIVEDTIELPVQINGKVREKLQVAVDISEEELKTLVLNNEQVHRYLEGKELKKFIYVKGRLVSIVI